jgi:hypothetical protein
MTDMPLKLDGIDHLRAANANAVRQTLTILFASFQRREAEPLLQVYADETDWVYACSEPQPWTAASRSFAAVITGAGWLRHRECAGR